MEEKNQTRGGVTAGVTPSGDVASLMSRVRSHPTHPHLGAATHPRPRRRPLQIAPHGPTHVGMTLPSSLTARTPRKGLHLSRSWKPKTKLARGGKGRCLVRRCLYTSSMVKGGGKTRLCATWSVVFLMWPPVGRAPPALAERRASPIR